MLESPLETVYGHVGVVGDVLHGVEDDNLPFRTAIDYGDQFVEFNPRMSLLFENFGEAGTTEWQLIGTIHLYRDILERLITGQLNISYVNDVFLL